ncbi:MAG TPA: hypothetical protein VM366_18255 [Anaerolineae bacterium]|nr:hypothetical protein [Anaerolineae bacterium]
MTRRPKQLTQIIIYIFSAIVILSMVLGLIGPILFRTPSPPTPTPLPTWTPWPTLTPTATAAPTAAPPPPPSPTPKAESDGTMGAPAPRIM